jgi:hypothetical protein
MSEGINVDKKEGDVLTASFNRWTSTWTGRLEDKRPAGEQGTGSTFYCSIG